MKIIIKRNEQQPEITMDMSTVQYPYAIRETLILAMELNGYTKETINEVFGMISVDCKKEGGEQ